MALLHEAVEAKKLDVRVVERNVQRGAVASTDVEKALKALPDDAEGAEWVNIESLRDEGDDSSTRH